MANIGYFDATQVQPGGALEVIPAGDYRVMIADSALEATKNGQGQFLKLTLQVIDGPHSGATLIDRLNLLNANPKAVEIAQRTLSAICHAVGVLQVQDSSQLHHRPLVARVAYVEGGRPDGQGGVYGPSNEIKSYKAIAPAQPSAPQIAHGQAPLTPPPGPGVQPPAASAAPVNASPVPPQGQPMGSGVPPWQRAA